MNATPKYRIVATGKTYPIKDELVSWDFRWSHDDKQWAANHVAQGTMNLLKNRVSSGAWEDVELHITEERS